MYWANFLHIYQPPIQTKAILERVVNESYRKIFQGLEQNPKAKLTLNINSGLSEMLVENGYKDVIAAIRKLLERGQVEITGTAKFHPLLPKLPPSEIERQIQLNEITNREFFGPAYQPLGFFPPEMAYNDKVGKIVKKLDFKWIILDETGLDQPPDYQQIYKSPEGLNFFFRERETSFKILSAQLGSAKMLIKALASRLNQNQYLLTAMDGETFGHHRPGLEEILWQITREKKLPTLTISELFKHFPEKITIEPRATSWAFTEEKISRKFPFLRWDDPDNEIQQKQWTLVQMAIEAVEKDGRPESRKLLDKALYSDQFWWASARPWWSLEMIEQGAHGFLKTIQTCQNIEEKEKQNAKELYLGIIITGFEWQRSGKVAELAKKEDEEIRQRMAQNSSALDEEDYLEIIDNLTRQMQISAKNQEFLRAEELKKRIMELKERQNNPSLNLNEEIKVNQ